ncbi:hypothetical protein TEA_007873 [Camellia sinensis var. sinensis]|uniref:Phytocyanin domain-containing protein n=1 Tax=Camellia sinensis var. sinensis TaxID=542762 RepID=A0A4S4E4D4_CAMSN|nr:hypothetical protein TEA_007873 [Camellia sinensis var. sinensis]
MVEVRKRDYITCNTSSPIIEHKDGNTKVKLDRSGPFYFINREEGHCDKGQKLIVVVMSAKLIWKLICVLFDIVSQINFKRETSHGLFQIQVAGGCPRRLSLIRTHVKKTIRGSIQYLRQPVMMMMIQPTGTVKQNYVNILLMLMRLRQACDHLLLVRGYNSSSTWRSSIEMAKKLPRDKQVCLLNCLEAFVY